MTKARRLVDVSHHLSQRQLDLARESNTEILTLADPTYPALLHQLDLPPPVLYCRGRIPSCPAIAIVGSRQASRQGLDVAEVFGRDLAAFGLAVVSGFARGVDLAAHQGALSATGGRTVAVLGCGLDIDYPRGRHRIRSKLPTQGAFVTEFPFGAPPLNRNFPIRNRIIAALAIGILVIQGTPRSGSLITARLALDLGREIYAVPGSIFDQRSAGPNALIRDGAMLVQQPAEILESLPIAIREELPVSRAEKAPISLEGPPGELLSALSPGHYATAEQLASETGRALDQVLEILLDLEMSGLVRRLPGATFSRKP